MPAATDAQIPKPLTYTLMYHFLWCVLFLLSALTLLGVFLASGRGIVEGVLPPLILVALGLIAGAGFLAAYVVRVQLLLGEISREDGFRWSSRSSWSVILMVPFVFLGLHVVQGNRAWSVPMDMTLMAAKIEVVVWWISHLLSVRGLAKGRKLYLAPAAGGGATGSGTGAPVAAGASLAS